MKIIVDVELGIQWNMTNTSWPNTWSFINLFLFLFLQKRHARVICVSILSECQLRHSSVIPRLHSLFQIPWYPLKTNRHRNKALNQLFLAKLAKAYQIRVLSLVARSYNLLHFSSDWTVRIQIRFLAEQILLLGSVIWWEILIIILLHHNYNDYNRLRWHYPC